MHNFTCIIQCFIFISEYIYLLQQIFLVRSTLIKSSGNAVIPTKLALFALIVKATSTVPHTSTPTCNLANCNYRQFPKGSGRYIIGTPVQTSIPTSLELQCLCPLSLVPLLLLLLQKTCNLALKRTHITSQSASLKLPNTADEHSL